MTIQEIQMNLFDLSSQHVLAHCISSDFALGAGIAKMFRAKGVAGQLRKNFESKWDGNGYALYTSCPGFIGAYNLVTKERYWHKPTYDTLRQSLISMRDQMKASFPAGETIRIGMPYIGCGLDRLEWPKVRPIIEEIFAGDDIDITVCYL